MKITVKAFREEENEIELSFIPRQGDCLVRTDGSYMKVNKVFINIETEEIIINVINVNENGEVLL